jgi:hypothetical protein
LGAEAAAWQKCNLAVAGACLEMRWLHGGGSWLHALLAIVAMDGDDNCNGDCLSKKGDEQGIRREEIERWVCFFMLSYFVIVFWLIFFNAGLSVQKRRLSMFFLVGSIYFQYLSFLIRRERFAMFAMCSSIIFIK